MKAKVLSLHQNTKQYSIYSYLKCNTNNINNSNNTKRIKHNNNNINPTLLLLLQTLIAELLKKEKPECKITVRLLKELVNIKHILKRSSYEIQQIFQYPLKLLKRTYSIGKILMEAFNEIIFKDELISELILQIKETYYKYKTKDILYLISIIEDDHNYQNNELIEFNNELNVNENESIDFLDDECLTNNTSFISKRNKHTINKRNTNTSTTTTVNEEYDTSLQTMILPSGNIDDIVKYICSDDHKKKKKKKKKNKGKDTSNVDVDAHTHTHTHTHVHVDNEVIECNKENTNDINVNNNGESVLIGFVCGKNGNSSNSNGNSGGSNGYLLHNNTNNEKDNEVIVSFKKKIKDISVMAYQYNKIMPEISETWLNSILFLNNNVLNVNNINNTNEDKNNN